MLKKLATCIALMALSGCSATSIAQKAFPDRVIYEIESPELEATFRYVCEPSDSEAQTKARVSAAHAEFEGSLISFAEKQAEVLLAGVDADQSVFKLAKALNSSSEAWAEQKVDEIEEMYQCLVLPDR